MPFHTFEKFVEMIEALPPKEILPALELEYRNLQNELASVKAQPVGDHLSIFTFRTFVYGVRLGLPTQVPKALPIHHLDFFKRIVVKLVGVGELPPSAFQLFDKAFLAPKTK